MDMSRREFLQAGVGGAIQLRSADQGSSRASDAAFLSISELSELIRTRKMSPVHAHNSRAHRKVQSSIECIYHRHVGRSDEVCQRSGGGDPAEEMARTTSRRSDCREGPF